MSRADTLVSLFFDKVAEKYDAPFLWQKVGGIYVPTTWIEAKESVIHLARALKKEGIEKGDRVCLVSENRTEWAIADLAIMAVGAITVPAYTTNTVNDHRHILNNSGAKAVIVSTQKLAEPVLHATHDIAEIDFVVSIEALSLKQEINNKLLSWQEMIETGKTLDDDIEAIARETLMRDETCCIIYTSGTGGAPKGVMLSHRAILHNCIGAKNLVEKMDIGEEVFLSFLPLSHSYEHSAGLYFPIYIGAQIYYAERIDTLASDMQIAKPTLMAAVPRLYETMRAKILKALEKQGGMKAKLFYRTLELGTIEAKGERKLSLFEKLENMLLTKLVRQKVRTRFGGRLKAFVSGGGPLNPDVGYFFTALGVNALQGYGQTEAGPVISANLPDKVKMATVGPALTGVEIKIAPDGEILVRGDLVMNGYWRNEKATEETIIDGWLHTGDVGFLDEDDYLQITDRKKDIIVNSGGDNLSPQRVEGFLTLEREIAQAMVYGDRRPHLVGLIIPDEDFAMEWAIANDCDQSLHKIVEHPDFIKLMGTVISRINKDLSNIEKVRKFILAAEPFTLENGQMTPTMKIRRHVIREHYGLRLDGLY